MTTAKLYHYPNCSTCKRARKWLEAAGVHVELIDIVKTPPSASGLQAAINASGLPLKRFFNTSGQSYRAGNFRARLPDMSRDEQIAALAADGKLIKRPLLVGAATVLVGFREADWQASLLPTSSPSGN